MSFRACNPYPREILVDRFTVNLLGILATFSTFVNSFKGSDRLCKVVELSMHGSVVEIFFRIHLRHIKRFRDL